MKKKNILFIICLLMAVFAVSTSQAQSVSIWDGTSEIWTQGNGTESNPYLIENAQQLAYIAEMVNGGVTHYDNTYFKLTTNVQIDSTIAWQPIGLNSAYYFSGHLDGDNHLVTLHLHTSTLQYVGLFGYLMGNASVNNVNINGTITQHSSQNSSVGALVGCVNGGTTSISNCINYANITSTNNASSSSSVTQFVGGIVGQSSGTLRNCSNTGTINAIKTNTSTYNSTTVTVEAGGLVGYASGTCYSCYNSGDINGTSGAAGGIIGCSASYSNIYQCNNAGNINGRFSGGVIGYGRFEGMRKCCNTGSISSNTNNSSCYSGGIVGYYPCGIENVNQTYNIIAMANCYNTGNVSGYNAGGIFGKVILFKRIAFVDNCPGHSSAYAYYEITGVSRFKITNCYNSGMLNGSQLGGIIANVEQTITGGDINNYHLCGSNYSPTFQILNSYYLNTCGGAGTGTAKTEAQMKSSSFPVILNTDSVVFVKDITPNINQGYPVFGSVRTLAADSIGTTTATLRGDYHMLYDVDAHGFEYKKTSESDYTTVTTTGYSPVSKPLTGLQGGTQYTYRFFVQKDGVYYRGEDRTFNTVQCNLTAQITSSSNTLCDGDTVVYTASASSSLPSTYQFTWNTGDHSNAISVTDGASYTVTVTDAYGCTATQTKQMTLYPAAAAFITGSTVLCNNGSTTLTANGGNTYFWNTGSAQRIITVNQPGIYIATVQTVYGCSASDTVEVVAFANPVINGNTVFCSGDYTTLTAFGGETYLWSTGATTASINVNTAGNYSVTASTSNGCSGSASVTVIQNQADNVTISGNTVICSGIGTTLTASSGADYLWSTGETTQSITANNPGVHSVTVTSSNGCSNSTAQTVSLMEQTTISGNNHICSGQSTTLSANGSGIYAWSNGANTSFITVNTPGNYSVTVTLPNGCASSATVDVTTGTTPTPTILGNTTICQGETTILTANGGSSYVWSDGSSNNTISVSQSGVYTVTATNTEGCSNTANVTVTVNPLPNVSISGNNSFCQGDNVTLTATGANTYVWSNTSNNASITVSNAGNYTVTGTDGNGCSNTATKAVSVNPTYNTPLTHSMCDGESYNFYGQNITAAGTYTHTLQTVNGCDSVLTLTVTLKALPPTAITGNTTLCEGETTTLVATGGVSYAWSNGGTSNSTTVNQSGVYTVIATNAEGCSATANVTVTVNPLPTITIGGSTTVCAGNSTMLTASGANSYSWSTGDNTASVNIDAFGVYTVTGTSSEGCSNTASVTVLISQLPNITITGMTDICAGENTTLTANGGETYLWSDGTTNNNLTVSTAGTYQVIGYNAAGCNAMASATVNVWQPTTSEFSISTPDSCYTWNSQTYCTSGDYTQTLQTVHGCDSVVTLHLTITVGIDEHDLGASMTVYPNPTTSVVNVQCTMNNVHEGTVEFQLFDAFGRLLRTTDGVGANNDSPLRTNGHGSSVQTQIDLSHYAAGVYFIKAVAKDNVIAVRKVVKQ